MSKKNREETMRRWIWRMSRKQEKKRIRPTTWTWRNCWTRRKEIMRIQILRIGKKRRTEIIKRLII